MKRFLISLGRALPRSTRNHSTSAFDAFVLSDRPNPFREVLELKDGRRFICDEEAHMLPHPQGDGYWGLSLGSKIYKSKYEIVRKLGWGAESSVWLAKEERYVLIFMLSLQSC